MPTQPQGCFLGSSVPWLFVGISEEAMEELFKKQQAGANMEPWLLIINAVPGRTQRNNHHSNNPRYEVED